MKRYANAALDNSAFLLRFRFRSYMVFLLLGYRRPGAWFGVVIAIDEPGVDVR